MHSETHNDIVKNLGLGKATPFYRKTSVWVLLLLGIVIATGGFFLKNTQDSVTPQFKTVPVGRGNLTVTVTATGQLEPVNEVEVGTEVSGTIKTIEVDYNSVIKAGQILAKLDTARLEGEVAQSQASLQLAQAKLIEAKATVNESRKTLERLQQMQTASIGKLSAQQDVDKAEATLKRAQASEASAQAQIAQAQAKLKVDENNLAKAVIRSPIDGIVLERRVEPGQTVAASLQAPTLFWLAEDLTQMVLHVNVDEADVGHVKEGQTATFAVDAYPERKFQAQIVQVRYAAKTVNNVVVYETLLTVDNKDLSLRPGMTATADIVVKQVENALLVPNAALRFVPPVRENAAKGQGNFMNLLLPHMGGRGQQNRPSPPLDRSKPKVWILQAGVPTAIPVNTGMSDGHVTEVFGDELKPDQALLVETVMLNK